MCAVSASLSVLIFYCPQTNKIFKYCINLHYPQKRRSFWTEQWFVVLLINWYQLRIFVIKPSNFNRVCDWPGFSDPYCMLGIIPAHEKPVGLRKGSTAGCLTPNRASQKKKTALELIPARFIKTTSVKENTLDPVWNERFRL